MSEETFYRLQKCLGNQVEKQVALQCAPLLMGIKASNLLNMDAGHQAEVFRLFERSPISCRVLYAFQGRLSLLLYRPERLWTQLQKPEVKALLDVFGYEEMGLEEILTSISIRYQEHMDGFGAFPHEIGLILGYPPVDVTGFIEKNGQDFLYSGYWKVYGNLPETLKLFEQYDRARDYVIHMAGNGRALREIMAVS